ncbi:MAG TPA: dihydrofolate reductase family protein [Mycobacteriales bacterium]|nr:dihydrofolate reductase family protein [Mycobacteriales bacterium]
MKIVVVNFISMDGVIQSPLAESEDVSGDFTAGGWAGRLSDDTVGQFMQKSTMGAAGLLLGRVTYQNFVATWSQASEDNPAVAAMNRIPKYVASRTLTTTEWVNSTILGPDIPTEIGKLRELPGGDLVVFGSGDLLQTLSRHDLIDEYRLLFFPVILGKGKRMFTDDAAPASFRLTDSVISENGVAIHTYNRIHNSPASR